MWEDVQRVVNQDFHWKFSGPLYMVFWVKKSMFDQLMLFQVSFPPVEVRCQSCLCPNKPMTLQTVIKDKWIHKGGYRQFRGEWVSPKKPKQSFVIFTPELVFYGQIWLFCALRLIFPENWVLCLKLHQKCQYKSSFSVTFALSLCSVPVAPCSCESETSLDTTHKNSD